MTDKLITCAKCGARFTDGLWWQRERAAPPGSTAPRVLTSAPFQYEPGECPLCRHINEAKP